MQREEERPKSCAKHEQPEHHSHVFAQAGHHDRHERGQEHPQAHEGDIAKWAKPQTRISVRNLRAKMLAPKTIQAELERRVRPEKAPDGHTENEPRRPSQESGY